MVETGPSVTKKVVAIFSAFHFPFEVDLPLSYNFTILLNLDFPTKVARILIVFLKELFLDLLRMAVL